MDEQELKSEDTRSTPIAERPIVDYRHQGLPKLVPSRPANSEPKRLAPVLFVVFVIVGLVVAYLIWCGNPFSPFNAKPFVSEDWKATRDDGRAAMAGDLVRHHLHRGMTFDEVKQLLGDPDDSGTDGDRIPDSSRIAYGIGNWSLIGWDAAFVYVHFGSDGRVWYAELDGY